MKLSDTPINPCKLIVEREGLDPRCTFFDSVPHNGMTLRQYYAGLAMQGLCAAVGDNPADAGGWIDRAARRSVWMADALIAELEKTND